MDTCTICKKEIPKPVGYDEPGYFGGTGYARNDKDEKICYQCCAEQDKQYMRDNGKITLYLTADTKLLKELYPHANDAAGGMITNWPGTLTFRTGTIRKSRHNIARYRYDTWFVFEGKTWHAVQYGDNTQIAHCRKTKQPA